MSILLLGVLMLYVFYKLVDMGDGGTSNYDGIEDFLAMKDASSIARGENPLDPKAQIKSMTDPLDLFGDDK